jgi:hypothetical protein
MCIQVPCVYLLSAASTVIRNTHISKFTSDPPWCWLPTEVQYINLPAPDWTISACDQGRRSQWSQLIQLAQNSSRCVFVKVSVRCTIVRKGLKNLTMKSISDNGILFFANENRDQPNPCIFFHSAQ